MSADITNEREYNDQYRNDLKRSQLELLAKKLELAQVTFEMAKQTTLAQKFADVAANRFASNVPED